jgi:Cys-rich repeat protein
MHHVKPIRIFQFRGLRAAALGAVFALGCSGESVVGGPTDAAADTAADTAADDLGVDAPSLDTPDASPDDVAADVLADDAADVVDVADTGPPGCARNEDCANDPAGRVCNRVTGRCVGCDPGNDTCPVAQRCDPATSTCVAGCRNDEGCAMAQGDGGTAPRRCDTATNTCVECAEDSHCGAGRLCRGNVCVAACTVTGCPTGEQCCEGACVNTTSNTAACGACGAACTAANATPSCTNGLCGVGTCAPGYANCDGAAGTGCEVDTRIDPTHCGGCGRECAPVVNGVATCTMGMCGFRCAEGFGDCDGDASNGCETDLRADRGNCGACGQQCSAPANATAACVSGLCGIGTCSEGFGDCDDDDSNGCETNTRATASHCGACGNACPAGQVCSNARCETPCPRGLTNCGGECVSLAYDPANCGRCGNACVGGALCGAGMCISTCGAGQVTCAGGCTNPQTDPNNCGACGTVCTPGQSCVAGMCRVVCVSGQQVCNDACVDTSTSLLHCGACGNACGPGEQCMAGRCTLTCRAPQVVCGAECAELSRDPNHCGMCGRQCPTGCFDGACARVDTLEAGEFNNCARYTSGRVFCWGRHIASSTTTAGMLTASGGAYGHRGSPSLILQPSGTPLESVEQVVLGGSRVCARVTGGVVYCWGFGVAMGVVSGLPPVTQLTARASNFCGLATDGRVYCWDGLPRATTAPALAPAVTLAASAVEVVAGGTFTCARLGDRRVQCWGTGTSGQLGNAASVTSATPVFVSGLSDAAALTAGTAFACALRTNGTVSCWGANSDGQLGDNSVTNRNAPVAVMGLSGVTSVRAGLRHACAILEDGTVRCWGDNLSSQLGNGNTTDQRVPVAVMGLQGRQLRITADDHHTCVVSVDRRVACWGANPFGEAGGDTEIVSTPRPVQYMGADLRGIVDVQSGRAVSGALMATTQWRCALHGDGRVFCWAASNNTNSSGQLGIGSTTTALTPTLVSGLTDATQIAVGWLHACAIRRDRTVVCWGSNAQGQLGDGTTTNRTAPVAVMGLTDAVEIQSGDYHTCARRGDGSVWCWGYNYFGELGNGTMVDRRTAAPVMQLAGAVQLAAGANYNCARLGNGQVHCWGRNLEGQLGDGFRTNRSVPFPVQASTATPSAPVAQTGFVDLQCDYYRCYGRLSNGSVLGWGWSYPARTSIRPELAGVSFNRRVVVFSEPIDTECEIRTDGITYCRGRNEFGQIGIGRASFTETAFTALTPRFSVIRLGRGYGTPCGVERTTGRVLCWGWAGFDALAATGASGLSTRPYEITMP